MDKASDSCLYGPIPGYRSLIDFLFGFIQICLMILIMLALRFKSTAASWYNGDSGVKEGVTIILPIYYPVCFYTLFFGFISGVLALFGYGPFRSPLITCVKWTIVRFCCEGLAIFFLHNGIGRRASINALFYGGIWAVLSGTIPYIVYVSMPNAKGFLIFCLLFTCNLFTLLVFYSFVHLIPQHVLHHRPALVRFASSNVIIALLFLSDIILLLVGFHRDSCTVVAISDFCYFLQPFIVLYALRQDTMFWQGLYGANETNLNQPLLGVWEMGRETIGIVADTINQLERRVVPVIAFGQLRIDTSKFFSGGTARVYRGQYKQHDVAIKILFNMELTPANVISFCDESTLLNSLQHTNIVKCYGVAVMPPALCLVTEFCEYGSLYDFLHSLEYNVRQTRTSTGLYRANVLVIETENRSNHNAAKKTKKPADSFRMSRVDPIDNPMYARTTDSNEPRKHDTSSAADSPKISSGKTNERSSVTFRDSITNPARDRKSTASQLADIIGRSMLNPSQNSGSYVLDEETGDGNSSVLSSSFVSGSTLEKFGFSVHITSSNASGESDGSKSNFFSTIKTALNTSANQLSNSVIVGSNMMKSAVTLMRSQDMGYGLGPKLSFGVKASHDPKESSQNTSLLASATAKMTSVHVKVDPSLSVSGNGSRLSVGHSLPLPVRLAMARDAAAGVAYLHASGLLHCDIKSLNFLVGRDLTIKLADLGEARRVDSLENQAKSLPRNINWSSPEVLDGATSINLKADVWSLAMVITEIFSGDVPFDTEECRLMSLDAFKEMLKKGFRPPVGDLFLSKNPWFRQMISDAWAYNAEDRLSAIEIVDILDTNIQSIIERQKIGAYSEHSIDP